MAEILILALGGFMAYEIFTAKTKTPVYNYPKASRDQRRVLNAANENGILLSALRLKSLLPFAERQPTLDFGLAKGETIDPVSAGRAALMIQQEQVDRYSKEVFRYAAQNNGTSVFLPSGRAALPMMRLATRSGAGTAAAYPLCTFEKEYNHPEVNARFSYPADPYGANTNLPFMQQGSALGRKNWRNPWAIHGTVFDTIINKKPKSDRQRDPAGKYKSPGTVQPPIEGRGRHQWGETVAALTSK